MKKQQELISYQELSCQIKDLIMCNPTSNKLNKVFKLISGKEKDSDGNSIEVMQWYIISELGADYLIKHTNELVYYDNELEIYVWAISFYGESWESVYTELYN